MRRPSNVNNIRYYIQDGLGHTRALLDNAGNVTDWYVYEAWGGLNNSLSSTPTANPFRWNGAYGYEWIPSTGLYHVGAREYDPRVGRWLQRDPIDVGGGEPNLYLYCHDDPLNSTDPSGLQDEDDIFAEVGVQENRMGGRRGPGAKWGQQAAQQLHGFATTAAGLHPGVALTEAAYGRDCSGRRLGSGERVLVAAATVGSGGGGFLAKVVSKGRKFVGSVLKGLGRLFGIGRKVPVLPRAYQIAKAGGRHARTLTTYLGRSDAEIQRALRGYEKQVALHQQKIANPAQFVQNWSQLSPQQQAGLLAHWQKEIINFQELADVMRGILLERGCEP